MELHDSNFGMDGRMSFSDSDQPFRHCWSMCLSSRLQLILTDLVCTKPILNRPGCRAYNLSNRNRNLQTSEAPLESQQQISILFTSAATNVMLCYVMLYGYL